jgi:serine/threonine protein kinase
VIGALIGQYRIVSAVGSGGMGTVYVGEHTLIGRRAAIKVLNPDVSQQREVVDRFFNEARAAAAVRHPGVVQIFDFGFTDDGSAYLVMELLEGKSLAAVLRDTGALPVSDALHVVRQVAWSIAAVHAAGVIHRDLKPDNIHLVRDPNAIGGLRVKILDFGVAKLGDVFQPALTMSGRISGTPLYMAPEQFVGKVDVRSDVYAAGCMLFEALVGKPPFQGVTLIELGLAHTSAPPPAPSSLRPTIAPDLDAIVLRCLAKDPAQRFSSMSELAQAIEGQIEATPLGPHPPGAPAVAASVPLSGEVPAGTPPELVLSAVEQASLSPANRAAPPPAAVAPPAGEAPAMRVLHGGSRSPTPQSMANTVIASLPALPPVAQLHPMYLPDPPGSPAIARSAVVSQGASVDRLVVTRPSLRRGLPETMSEAPGFTRVLRAFGLTRVGQLGDDNLLAAVFRETIPDAFRDSLELLVEFFGELFTSARTFGDRVVQLGGPAIGDLASRDHYVLFVDDLDREPLGGPATSEAAVLRSLRPLKTTAFRARVAPLAEQLAILGTPPGSVVIAILAAPQLGQGARETIFALRKERNLYVVPIAASEVRRACEAGTARLLLLNRIADLHTVSDPFSVLDDFTDPTRCIGFAAEVADLVKHIIAGGTIVSVAGPPGSGKSGVVAMAEYGCDTASAARRFVRLPCHELTRDSETLIRELQDWVDELDGSAPPRLSRGSIPPEPSGALDLRTALLRLGVRPQPDGDPAAAASPRPPRREQLVIVLEDADRLILLASSTEPDAALRDRARELWRRLAQLCASGGHTVIVTSVRDFQDQVPLERPVDVARVPLRALNRRESDRLITSLGELVGFSPTRRTLARLHRESGGNVYALRLLCSTVIRAMRERPGYSPLARLAVVPGMVDAAAAHIAATGSTFRAHVSVWLDDIEKLVLQHVARDRPRSPRQIRQALEASADAAQIVQALDGLELMGLVESRRGRHRVRIPLFERWIKTHLDPPPRQREAIQHRRASKIAVGCTIALLLAGAYEAWLRSTRSAEAQPLGDCLFELDHPDRAGTDEAFDLLVYQTCKAAAPHQLALQPVRSALRIAQAASDCTPATASCLAMFKATAGQQAHDAYRVQLVVDTQPLLASAIAKDRFASMRAIGEKTVPTIAWVLPLISVVVAFHKDLRRSLRSLAQLLGRRRPPRSEPAPP